IDELLGIDAAEDLAALERLALCWSTDEGISTLPAVRETLGPFPAGLGRSLPTPADADVAAMLDELPDDGMNVLPKLATGAPSGRTRDAAVDGDLESARRRVQGLLARGRLARRGRQTVELPRESGLNLRGGRAFGPQARHAPDLCTRSFSKE